MDSINKTKKEYQQALDNIISFISKCKLIIDEEYKDISEITTNSIIIKSIDKICIEYSIPLEIKLILCYNTSLDSKISCNHFSFHSILDILNNIEYIKGQGQTRYIDLGMSYHGIGHWVCLAWDKIENKFFFRLDGGSDGWQREENEKLYISFNPSDEKYKEKLFDIIKTIDILNTIDNNVQNELFIRI